MTDNDSSILIKHGIVISMDPNLGIIRDCDVLIEGNTIVKVEPNIALEKQSATRIIDATNCIISPGYIDGHHHLWQQLLRSVGSDWSLMDYALIMRTCFGSIYDPDDVYTANYAGAIDLLHNGITTVVDHCHILNTPAHTDAAIEALKDAQIRGCFCYGLYANPPLSGPGSYFDTTSAAFTPAARRDDVRRALAQHFSPDNNTWDSSLLTLGLACNEPETAGAAGIAAEIAFGRSLALPLITAHVAIGHYDANLQIVQALGRPSSTNEQTLGPDLLFSHGAAWTDAECSLLATSGAGIVCTPETELQMGMGHPVAFRVMDAHGCTKVGLGVDVTCSQNNDMVAQARMLLQAQRARDAVEAVAQGRGPPLAVRRKALDVLRLATQGGADAVGVGHLVGSLSPGKRADVVITECEGVGMVPIVDPVGMLVCNSGPKDVKTVVVDGRVVKDEGRLVGVDWEKLKGEVRTRSERLIKASEVILPEMMKGFPKEGEPYEEAMKKITEIMKGGERL
ncbi:putative guanine deaminase [Macrophomina phaseolina]|uniref:Guanine deaminase n=1 Tax=Macrophomina phaseolina TaxID=35725 RepID=A0ABQ8GHR9_9PEZI|nr:putative guanine deaminase [Macrophomina phaseolina]